METKFFLKFLFPVGLGILWNALLASTDPNPSPEGGSEPEPSVHRLDWWNIAYENKDPQFRDYTKYLTSVPENAGHCPPTDWVEAFWELSMSNRKFKNKQVTRYVDEAYRHCKPLCMGIFPEWWEMTPNFNEMLNMPWVTWWPITAKRILEEVNGRNCPCIHCLRYPGELLFLNATNWQFYEDNEFLYLTDHNGYDWDGCICEGPVAEP